MEKKGRRFGTVPPDILKDYVDCCIQLSQPSAIVCLNYLYVHKSSKPKNIPIHK